MNPNNNVTLDPKLKETFDRVMGTNVAPTASVQEPHIQTNSDSIYQNTPQSSPQPAAVAAAQAPAPIQVPAPALEEQKTVIKIPPVDASVGAPTASEQAAAQISENEDKKSLIVPIAFISLGVIFFILYAVFWVKFFNVSLPF
ncbi:MAG TPA: hypothetical protein VJC10_01900 [Patescibacteria group bacterium]|nr:hypothetical protein [Patescibacteria group bacterium]